MESTSPTQIALEVERFIRTRFRVSRDDSTFGKDTNLWDEGYVDSLGVTEVIAFLEGRFAIKIPSDMLFDPDFVCINGIARLTFGLINVSAAVGSSE
jgi:acyl carrier protein